MKLSAFETDALQPPQEVQLIKLGVHVHPVHPPPRPSPPAIL